MTKKKPLREEDLINAAFNLIQKDFTWSEETEAVHTRRQVEIGGCIADGLAFVNAPPKPSKIIGLEAKTDGDNFSRLYNQVSAYLTICDEVYLVIEKKKPPLHLPFYVGVIQVTGFKKAKVVRYATSLKHTINAGECWSTLLKAFLHHTGVDVAIRKSDNATGSGAKSALDFFDAVETIKRKLIWNQFVVGFHQTYVKDYIPMSGEEKRIVRAYFGQNWQMELGEEEGK